MSLIDKQITKTLDYLHRTLSSNTWEVCRWKYKSKSDTYVCEHIALTGKQVVEYINYCNGWTEGECVCNRV